MKKSSKNKLFILGLGYVGLSLAVEFGKKFITYGFDKSKKRIKELNDSYDINGELSSANIHKSKNLIFTENIKFVKDCDFIIICAPTPIDKSNKPDLRLLEKACKDVGKHLSKNSIVCFESTVYPGVTEDVCVPILSNESKLLWKKDFFVGYSPERINPGDKKRSLINIDKLVAADTPKTLNKLSKLYNTIINSKIHKVKTIKTAEAAKVIENTQRDLNIAFMNELSIIFDKMKIDFLEVQKAANTKWNFLNFKPGLVGGHCIGVDPYYLTYVAKKYGYSPNIILSGRKINDDMHNYVYKKILKKIKDRKIEIKKIKTIMLGITFKQDCKDVRNSKAIELAKKIQKKFNSIDIFDPLVSKKEITINHKLNMVNSIKKNYYNVAILAVPHQEILDIGIINIINKLEKKNIFIDIMSSVTNEYKDLTL
tara:strand:- start:44058 stop:45335 length:1278 start_codon:yes stop_codon:yes gene_type:complete